MSRLEAQDSQQHRSATLTIRRLDATGADRLALERLAQRDSHQLPAGALLGLEVEGALLAAVEVESGEMIADPFSRTEELRSLLELRATQLRRRGRRLRLTTRHRRGRARAALASSPPGGGGRLLELPHSG